MNDPHRTLTASDIMTMPVITFRPETSIFQAIHTLLRRSVSGAPVVNDDNEVLGVLSELDCLRMLSSDEFCNGLQEEGGTVRDFMTEAGQTIPPDMDIYEIAHCFLSKPARRFPVVHNGKLLGQVSRRDVLKGIEKRGKKRLPKRHYPDYREPG